MDTEQGVYRSIMEVHPVMFDPSTREGNMVFYCDATYGKEKIKEDIERFLSTEYFSHSTDMFYVEPEHPNSFDQYVGVRVWYYSVVA